MKKILIPEKVAPETIHFLKERGYEVVLGTGLDEETLNKQLKGCVAIIVRVARVTRAMMQDHPELKIIAKHGAGYDNIDIEAARELGRTVVYAPVANSLSVAEHTIALILACAKRLKKVYQGYADGNYFVKNTAQGIDIHGKTLGLIGFGRIGSMVAQMAHFGFGMNVICFDPFLPKERQPDYVSFMKTMKEVLASSDFVSLHMPLTPENQNIIGKSAFEAMKKTAFLINTSRGGIVDSIALEDALKHSEIAGAGLDVTDPEPLPKTHTLFQLDNVIVTPHSAANTIDSMVRMGMDVAEGIDDAISGRTPRYRLI